MPWTGDADIVIGQAATRALRCNKPLIDELRQRGLSVFRALHPKTGVQAGPHRVCLNAKSPMYQAYAKALGKPVQKFRAGGGSLPFTYIDMVVLWQEGDDIAIESHMKCMYKAKDVYPLQAVHMHGRDFPLFANFDSYARSIFGGNWRKPVKTKHGSWTVCKADTPTWVRFFKRNTEWRIKPLVCS
jgi:hypothetical protein